MAWTSWGFDGTINEAQWSQMAGLLGNDYVAAGSGDCLVTAVPGARSVSVAAGTLYGDGVVSVNSGAETVAMTTPVNGQWYVIALRRTWATNTAALVAIAGATTTTTTPTAPPSSFPTLNTQPGVLTDQPIAWAWCNSANTTVVVFDIRKRAVKSMPAVVANAAERDAKYMTPWQGLQVWRDDLGAVETYYGLFNSSTNPGGRDTAGWYINGRAGGLIPVKAATVTIASGSGSVTSLGQVNFSAATSIQLDNVFSAEYRDYLLVLNVAGTGQGELRFRYTAGGSQKTTGYYWGRLRVAGNVLDNYSATGAAHEVLGLMGAYYADGGTGTFTISNPYESAISTNSTGSFHAISSGYGTTLVGGTTYRVNERVDGFYMWPAVGAMTGSIQVFGIND